VVATVLVALIFLLAGWVVRGGVTSDVDSGAKARSVTAAPPCSKHRCGS
jgi:hypothetical protein